MENLPVLELARWRSTRDALHGYVRVLGQLRAAFAPPHKHWWHITLIPSARGLTMTPMPGGVAAIEVTLDIANDRVEVVSSEGAIETIPLTGQSALELGVALGQALRSLGTEPPPLSDAIGSTVHHYDASAARRFWSALSAVDLVFRQFRGSLREETGPVQLFPHHFDLSLNWFSGRCVPGVDPNDAENADEQMNFGFVTGDDGIAEAYFYATAYPLPSNLTDAPLPAGAHWHTEGFTAAILPYAAIAERNDGRGRLLEFLTCAQMAGAERMP